MSSPDSLLRLERYCVVYQSASRTVPALQRVSLSIEPGEWLGVVGESGSGKSTLLRAILGMLPGNCLQDGLLQFRGRDLSQASPAEWLEIRGHQIGFVPQQALGALNPVRSIGSQLAEALILKLRLSPTQAWEKSWQLLESVQLSDPARVLAQYPHQLSGGMNQRVILAMALSQEPCLLLADEPTSAVDAELRLELLAEIRRQQLKRQMGLLFVTHDLNLLDHFADRLAVLFAGRLVELGQAAQVFARPQHPYTRILLGEREEAEDAEILAEDGHQGCCFAARCPEAAAICRKERPLWKGDATHGWSCHIH